MVDNRVTIYDYANGARYELSDRGYFDFTGYGYQYGATEGTIELFMNGKANKMSPLGLCREMMLRLASFQRVFRPSAGNSPL